MQKLINFKRQTSRYEKLVLDYIIHILILVAVLSSIFFFFISQIERETLNDEIDNTITNSINSLPVTPTPGLPAKLLDASNFFKKSKKIENTYNDGLKYVVLTILIGLLFTLVAIYAVFVLSSETSPPILFLIFRNFLLFILIGIVEYLFFINIASKYIPVKPSYIQELLKEKLS